MYKNNDKSGGSDRIAAYVGVSAPETPKYLVANNFLLEYFEQLGGENREYSYERFESQGILHSEEEQGREQLKAAFDRFLDRYLGVETIRKENSRIGERKFYFPLTQDMLTGSTPTLRHLLFQLQYLDDNFSYEQFQKLLAAYIFEDTSGINKILKILLGAEGSEIKYKKKPDLNEGFWEMLKPSERTRMKKLGQRLNEDLTVLLTHPYFTELDFYRRYQYLSVLLTSYVIQYILVRKGSSSFLLCKGGPLDNRLNGNIHRACCNNYAELRSLFPELLQNYYTENVSRLADKKGELHLELKNEEVWVQGEMFQDFSMRLSGSRRRMQLEPEKLRQAFGLTEEGETAISVEAFVLRYINLTGSRRGSTLTKISSTLPTCGKQIDMLFPKSNAKQKYFAMSGSIAEFYVRLYLAGKDQQYDYMDNFLEKLLERYHIVIASSREGDRLLKGLKPRLTALELSRNKQAFLDTLSGINCLIKLSDSGYVVTLPEKKGDFTLL